MNPNQPIQAQARQVLAGAQGGQPPMPQAQGLPVPPPQIAMQLAKVALTLDPMVLGTLVWRALKEHGAAMNSQGIQTLGQ